MHQIAELTVADPIKILSLILSLMILTARIIGKLNEL
jgi:hypothetical protein